MLTTRGFLTCDASNYATNKKTGSTKCSATNVSKPTSHSAVAKIKRKKACARLMVSRPLYTDDAAKTAGTNRDKRGMINFPFTWLLSWCWGTATQLSLRSSKDTRGLGAKVTTPHVNADCSGELPWPKRTCHGVDRIHLAPPESKVFFPALWDVIFPERMSSVTSIIGICSPAPPFFFYINRNQLFFLSLWCQHWWRGKKNLYPNLYEHWVVAERMKSLIEGRVSIWGSPLGAGWKAQISRGSWKWKCSLLHVRKESTEVMRASPWCLPWGGMTYPVWPGIASGSFRKSRMWWPERTPAPLFSALLDPDMD